MGFAILISIFLVVESPDADESYFRELLGSSTIPPKVVPTNPYKSGKVLVPKIKGKQFVIPKIPRLVTPPPSVNLNGTTSLPVPKGRVYRPQVLPKGVVTPKVVVPPNALPKTQGNIIKPQVIVPPPTTTVGPSIPTVPKLVVPPPYHPSYQSKVVVPIPPSKYSIPTWKRVYRIQVGAFRDYNNAISHKRFVQRVTGIPMVVITRGSLYLVQTKRFYSLNQINRVKSIFRRKGIAAVVKAYQIRR